MYSIGVFRNAIKQFDSNAICAIRAEDWDLSIAYLSQRLQRHTDPAFGDWCLETIYFSLESVLDDTLKMRLGFDYLKYFSDIAFSSPRGFYLETWTEFWETNLPSHYCSMFLENKRDNLVRSDAWCRLLSKTFGSDPKRDLMKAYYLPDAFKQYLDEDQETVIIPRK